MARHLLTGSLFTLALVVSGCGGDDDAAPTTDPERTTTSSATSSTDIATTSSNDVSTPETTESQSPTTGAGIVAGDGCWVHLFEEEDFDESDDHHRLSEPGRYADLRVLPGAPDDWTDDAESIRVGPEATVTVWPDTDFRGQPLELGPGSEHADLDEEPESLELMC